MFLFIFLVSFSGLSYAKDIVLSEQEIAEIGNKIFINECSLREDRLIQWNEGEDFLSCGIGHFIWYPKEYKGPFKESFPEFLDYAKSMGVDAPEWLFLQCPWSTREDFIKDKDSVRVKQLREFIIVTKPLQAQFIVKRLNNALALMLDSVTDKDRAVIQDQFERLESTPSGVFALADYINFKGLGILPSEQYNDKGWGLSQVLLDMRNKDDAPDALKEFARAANEILVERAKNAPVNRNEERWLPGWQNRVNRYLE